MTIRRQYSLPNCTLVLEGMSDNMGAMPQDGRPLLSILVNAECHLAGKDQPLAGGREFFESLVNEVSIYAQEFLSGIPHPRENHQQPHWVQLEGVQDKHLHRLTYQPSPETEGEVRPVAVDLTTVQLFDLIEAIDQFLADTSTLPSLRLQLAAVSRRYRKADQPVVKRAAPVAIGTASLALAGLALFFAPIPEVRKPEPAGETSSETVDPTAEPIPSPVEPIESPPSPNAVESPAEETSTAIETVPSPTESPDVEVTPSPSATPISLSAEEVREVLATASEISDPTEVNYLLRNLRRNLNESWDSRGNLSNSLEYRVSVTRDGTIIGYEPINQTPEGTDEETPLPDLIYTPTSSSVVNKEAIAPFKVVFTRNGIIQVSPWYGFQGTPNYGPEIEDRATIERLQPQVYQQIRDAWEGTASFGSPIEYRIGVTEEGVIADYEPRSISAPDYVNETPLPKLVNPEAAGIGTGDNPSLVPQKPLAQYQVVFQPDGEVQVNPLR